MSKLERYSIGFTPGVICPLCGVWHEIKYKYKHADIVACPKAEGNQVICMTLQYANDEISRLKNSLQFIEVKDERQD